MRTPKLCVYIPNLDGGARLRRALETLAVQTIDAPVVVIDNGSRDASPTAAEREMGARVIRLDRNIGFGRALNLGVAEFPAERLVFLNNDVECEPRSSRRLSRRPKRKPRIPLPGFCSRWSART